METDGDEKSAWATASAGEQINILMQNERSIDERASYNNDANVIF